MSFYTKKQHSFFQNWDNRHKMYQLTTELIVQTSCRNNHSLDLAWLDFRPELHRFVETEAFIGFG